MVFYYICSSKPMEHLLNELNLKIIETLNLVDVEPNDIDPDDHLIGGRLGLDSIDILELVMMIEKDYAVKINSKELGEKVFSNLKSLATYIYENSSEVS
jgi:acyl carrier protein